MRPPDMEFTPVTRGAALQRANWKCEVCEVRKEDGYHLEVHHELGIAYALKYYPSIPHTLIRSLANAKVVCDDCHLELDNRLRYDHAEIAARLVGMLID